MSEEKLKEKKMKMSNDFKGDFCIENYTHSSNDIAVISEITNMKVDASKLTFDYKMPQDNVQPKEVVIWKGIIIDKSKAPVYRSELNSNVGHATVVSRNLNFLKDSYTVAVTASNELSTVGATQSILAGNIITQGSSSLVVVSNTLNYVAAIFNSPANVLAKEDRVYILLYKGSAIGQGECVATQRNLPDTRSGLVYINFTPGTLVNGETYNVVFNPGSTLETFTAGYSFTYILQ